MITAMPWWSTGQEDSEGTKTSIQKKKYILAKLGLQNEWAEITPQRTAFESHRNTQRLKQIQSGPSLLGVATQIWSS